MSEESNKWGSDPASAQLDRWVWTMPDRPQIVLAVINWNDRRFGRDMRGLAPVRDCILNAVPFDFNGKKSTVIFLGFEENETGGLMKLAYLLTKVKPSLTVLYRRGKAVARMHALELPSPFGLFP